MKKILTASLVTAMALTSVNASSVNDRISELEAELAKVKKDLKKQKSTLNEVKAHDAGDNIKWGADVRTAIDNINYDMASGNEYSKNDLMSLRLWLNMEYAADSKNIFKGQLSMNKAFGADFYDPMVDGYSRTMSMGGAFDWTGNEALTDNSLKVRQAYWLYLGDDAFGTGMPWTFSLGRRPSTNGFLANLRDDDPDQSPLGHVINVEFDGLSSKLDLSGVTGISGMSIKLCMGQGSTNAYPMLTPTQYANDDNQLEDIKLAGFIFEPYNDGQFITKATWYRAYDLPGMEHPMMPIPGNDPTGFNQYGDMEGGAFSVLVDGLADDGFLADTKVFASIAYSKTHPDVAMLGSMDSETGTSYWLGAQLPVIEDGKLGLEYNHGSEYWRPFTYAEDTMIGSKIAARGDALEAYFTYQLTDALSAQLRYTKIDYDYTGSNGFFGNYSGTPMKIDTVKANAAWGEQYLADNPGADPEVDPNAAMAYQAIGMADQIVEAAQDIRFYIRYRF
ncbi:MAG TPA: DUF3373 family protein [Epsilonproteobacteria bacterium]|nr:DUF3373 family protein [Campylobacterota bacterium]